MLVRELLEKLTGMPIDAEVRISFTEEVLEDGMWNEYDTDAAVAAVEFDAENNTVTLVEEET